MYLFLYLFGFACFFLVEYVGNRYAIIRDILRKSYFLGPDYKEYRGILGVFCLYMSDKLSPFPGDVIWKE